MPGARREWFDRERVLSATIVVAALAAGVALRVWVYDSALGFTDSDEAIVGLMIRHALRGELTTFYWAQAYGGTQEVLLGVPVFALFGSGLLQLRVIAMTLCAVTAVLVWRVARRTLGEPGALAAGAVFWIWPPFVVAHASREWGFYGVELVYCPLLMLLALRVVERPSRLRVALFGLVLGLAFWESAQIIPIALGTVVWTVWKRPYALRHAWAGAAAAALGAAPWLVWNVRHDWASILPRSDLQGYLHGLRILASPLVPMALGLRAPVSAQPVVPAPLMYVLYGLLLALFGYGAWRHRRRPASLVFTVALIFVLIWPVSRRAIALTSNPSFLIVLMPVLALLLAHLAKTPVRAAALVVVCCAVSVVSLHRMEDWYRAYRAVPPVQPPAPRDLGPLIGTLDRLRLRDVYANYYIAFRLEFDTNERITASDIGYTGATLAPGGTRLVPVSPPRHAPYDRAVAEARRYGIVLFDGEADPSVVASLLRHGFRRHWVENFVVFAPPTPAGTG